MGQRQRACGVPRGLSTERKRRLTKKLEMGLKNERPVRGIGFPQLFYEGLIILGAEARLAHCRTEIWSGRADAMRNREGPTFATFPFEGSRITGTNV